MANPILVNTLRGEVVENRHRGAIAVCDPHGRVVHSWGDIDALVYPRSAIKLVQALPLIETGAADNFDVSPAELALACSSHNAEPEHVAAVRNWLARIGLEERALECGPHPPLHEPSARSLVQDQINPGAVHNNCSGKHTGMLAASQFLGEQTHGYIERAHPAQQRWFDVLTDLAGADVRSLPWSRDGCGIPVIALPLKSLATAFARVARPDDLPTDRALAINRLGSAIVAHPFMLAGSGRLCTEIMQQSGQHLLVKTGADGVYTAALGESGLGVALKIDDGLRDAAEVALLALLKQLNVLNSDEIDALSARMRMPIVNSRGILTGRREPAEIWNRD